MVSNEEMEDIMKIVKPQRGEFYPSLLGTLGVTFWGSMLSGKDVNRAGKVALKAGEAFWCFLIL